MLVGFPPFPDERGIVFRTSDDLWISLFRQGIARPEGEVSGWRNEIGIDGRMVTSMSGFRQSI